MWLTIKMKLWNEMTVIKKVTAVFWRHFLLKISPPTSSSVSGPVVQTEYQIIQHADKSNNDITL